MKKKLYNIVCLCSFIIVSFCACGKQEYQGSDEPVSDYTTEMPDSADNTPETVMFQATVIEASANWILVKPVDGSSELNSADQFSIPNEEQLELQSGDLVEITYNGDILESYPAQLGEVYEIVLIE